MQKIGDFFLFSFSFRLTDPSNFEKDPCSQKLNWSGLNIIYIDHYIILISIIQQKNITFYMLCCSVQKLSNYLIGSCEWSSIGRGVPPVPIMTKKTPLIKPYEILKLCLSKKFKILLLLA